MHRNSRLVLATMAAAALLTPAAAAAKKPAKPKPSIYRIGLAARSVSLDANGTFAGQPVYLGGYGLGNGHVGESVAGQPVPGPHPYDEGLKYDDGRAATGNLADGLHVRAAVISTGKPGENFAIADIENQGCFAQNKQGYGLTTMRLDAAAQIAALAKQTHSKDSVAPDHIDIQCDHSHGGPDLIGAWGGVPTEYLAYVEKQAVAAIVAAYQAQKPATLWYGTAPSGVEGRGDKSKMDDDPLLTNQMGGDPTGANNVMDDELRVLQARDPHTGAPLATILNLNSHPTVLGSSNTMATGDWPQFANNLMMDDAGTFGSHAMTVVGTLGRQQPARGDCTPDPANPITPAGDQNPAWAICKLTQYSKRVVARATMAVQDATELTGKPAVIAKTYFIQDPASNAGIMALNDAGEIGGAPIMRSDLPPWRSGNVVGTVTGSIRIGDILISSMPGEAYPQIPLAVRAALKDSGIKGFMTLGLSNDQLGYIIANLDDNSYAYPIERGVVDQNDNILFNMSQTLGERLTCSLLRGAGDVTGQGSTYRDSDQKCVAFQNDTLWPEGADTSGALTPFGV
jgi:hypothetical protein